MPKAHASAPEYNETRIQLAFIFKVLDFIDSLPNSENTLELCLYGFPSDEVNVIRPDIDHSKRTDIKLVNEPDINKIKSCNIIFLSKNYTDYKNILDYTKNSPILTFAEIKYFTDEGGMVEFYKYKGRYKFIINNELAMNQNILFNAKLLEISK
ncbi:MAG: YfiR family protein [Rickettsiales bacterium]|nr:YfiR family protein [Rickettsiales bacterium]